EAWNEPDLAEVFWPGSTADYYQLLKVTYLNLKYVDPTNQVLLAGLEYWNNMPFLDDLLKLMMADPTAPGNNYYFDVLPWHQYSRPSDVYDRVLQSRQKLAQTIGVKPIWVNEAGVSAWDESPQYNFQPYQWAATLQEQASYVIEAGAYAIAAGADKFFFYRLQDTAWPEALGLVRLDRTLRPSYVAYQVASHNLSFIDSATLQHMQNVEAIAMRRGTDRVTVVWNRTPNRLVAAIGARATTATVTDQTGATRTVRATGGAFQLDLGPATANNGVDATDYFIGGPPLILLESPAAQQTAEETNPVLSYGGSWDVLSTPGASGGAVRRAAVPGLGVAVDFDGPSVTWVTTKGPDHGIARVTVDGAVQADIDLYDPTELADIPYTFGEFSSGTHRFVMTILSQVNGASTGTLVDVDTISAQTLRQAPPPPTPSPVSSPTPTASPTPRPTATPIASPTPIATATPPLSPTPTVSPLVTVVTGTTGSTPAEPLEAIIDEIS
ncbi:MAG: hypothetical protein QOF51_159, partial [Chloroflexota bacterium]|nr:hypothetical protein [Chloroflexota bacterium]